MRPIVVRTTGVLPGPPQIVWELITDWERQSEWMMEMSDVRVTSDHRTGIGVEAEATVSIAGIQTRDPIRVDAWEPCRHLGIVHGGWVAGRGDLRLSPATENRTNLEWREELRGPWGLVGATGLRLFRPLLARTFRRDLRKLAELVDLATRYSR